jgi:3-oxoacyl-[acyl-carrier protein] reductase
MSFSKKNILVVGASSGIGAAVARTLLESGASVYIWNRRSADELVAAGARQSIVDVIADGPLQGESPETLHGVVYAPGTINLGSFRQLKPDVYRQDYEVNLVGAVKVLQAVHEPLLAAGGASVVLFSTVAVQTGMAFHASVAAAKGAVEGFARSLAAEYAPKKVRFNVVAPSLTETPLAGRLLSTDKKAEAAAERHPLKRIGTVGDQAGAALFLLDPANSWITGQIIGVDGGLGTLR